MYDFKLQSADGSQVWLLPFESINITEELNKGIDGDLTTSYKALNAYAVALGTTVDSITSAAAREWYLLRNGVPLYAGILLARSVSGGSSGATTYKLNFADFTALLAKRRTPAEDLYSNTDSSDIAWSLIDDSQALTNGDMDITRGADPSTKNRDRTFRYDNIRDAIVGMSKLKVDDGYDFDIDVTKAFNIYYPKGTAKPEIIISPFNTISWSLDKPLQGKLTNKVIVLGKGQAGVDMVTVEVEDTTPQTTWGLLEDTLAEKGVGVEAELTDRGQLFIDQEKNPSETVTITTLDSAPDIASYSVGDTIRVQIDDIDYDQNLRIKKRSLQIQSNGNARVTLTFEKL